MKIKITGMEALISGLNVRDKEEQIKGAVRSNSAELQQNAMEKVAKDTHALERSIRIKIENGGYRSVIKPNMEYAPYQEFGTRYQTGTPYMRPAFHEQKDKFIEDIKKIVKE